MTQNLKIAAKRTKKFLELLRKFKGVESAWGDSFNLHYNISFKLVGESFIRGLRLKAMTSFKNNSYIVYDINKYPENTLIVCTDDDFQYGIAYVYKKNYHNVAHGSFTPGHSKIDGVFNKLYLPWLKFLPHLEKILTKATIITTKIYFKGVKPSNLQLCQSLIQFKQMCCYYYDTIVKKDEDSFSESQLIIDDLKVRFINTPKPIDVDQGYFFNLAAKPGVPYKQGENSLYVFSIGTDITEFLVLSEKILIHYGIIKTDKQNGVAALKGYHYTYKNLGNFTKNKDLWFSADNGYMGSKQFITLSDYCEAIEDDFLFREKKKIPIPQDNTSLETGHNAEMYIIRVLNTFNSVKKAWKDTNNSKFDVYFKLKGEKNIRGLQVKAIISNGKTGYRMKEINKYQNGMLIVGIHTELNFGVAFLFDEKYNVPDASLSLRKNSKGVFSQLIRHGLNFNAYLEQMLPQAISISKELYLSLIPPLVQLERLSIRRFKKMCKQRGWSFKRNEDNASVTDVYVNGLKIQMKYVSRIGEKSYSYKANLCRSYNTQPYKKGDNDLYIIEIGERHGEFCCIPEKVLIAKGCISDDEYMPDHLSIQVFPVDYVKNKRESLINQKYINYYRGNWTSDPKFWFNTESGHMGKEKVKSLEEFISLF